MNPELALPVITTVAWLIIAGSALASFRLGWGTMIKMALAWVAIFLGLFLIIEWYMLAQGTASALL